MSGGGGGGGGLIHSGGGKNGMEARAERRRRRRGNLNLGSTLIGCCWERSMRPVVRGGALAYDNSEKCKIKPLLCGIDRIKFRRFFSAS